MEPLVYGLLGVNILFSLYICKWLGYTKNIVNATRYWHKGNFKDMAEWQKQDTYNQFIEASFGRDFEYKVDKEVKETMRKITDYSIETRLSELSHELAKKYTFEHFEEELKKEMSKKLGENIRQNLLNYRE